MFKQLLTAFFLLFVAFPTMAGERIPNDVKTFIFQRESCDHFRGEVPGPGEKRRMRDVNRQIAKLCKGTDKRLSRLKKKYAANAEVMRQLDEFEPHIEAPSR